jgi:hypothetical protein
MHALDDGESRLESLDCQVLTLAQMAPYQVPVQYLRCLKASTR